MCGIVGYTGPREAGPILLDGLERLEYRGYDSAGLAILSPNGHLEIRKTVGKLSSLIALLQGEMPSGHVGVGHTRWATHGRPSDINAHPQVDCAGQVVVVHNGIIENYAALKRELQDRGHRFLSQTDTEVLCHLIEEELKDGEGLEESVRRTAQRLQGANVFIAVSQRWPESLVAVRLGNAGGIVVGYGKGEMFLASDLPAILPHTREVAFLGDRELVRVDASGAEFFGLDGSRIEKSPMTVSLNPLAAAKGGFKHFMQKEIFEQPQAVLDTFRDRALISPPAVLLEDLPFTTEQIANWKRVVLVAMGTAFHASLIGKFMLERLARLPTEVDNASEFRTRDPLVDDQTLLIAVTQSGETADTLAALEEGRRKGAPTLAITNTIGSQATRLADGVFYTRCGLEVAVAASKTFLGQLTAFYLLGLYFALRRGVLSNGELAPYLEHLAQVPNLLGDLLASMDQECEALARRYSRYNNFLYLGRGIQYPVALEGALKLKELSYVHAEGYPAGEMKHGPIALIDNSFPVVALALRDHVYDKMVSNIEQLKAREALVIAVTDEGNHELDDKVDDVIRVPTVSPLLDPMLTVVPLQLLAYHIAVRRGCDVDQPRNLAKSVTVE